MAQASALVLRKAELDAPGWVQPAKLDSTTHVGSQGTGVAVTELGDVEGSLGVATQTLLGFRTER